MVQNTPKRYIANMPSQFAGWHTNPRGPDLLLDNLRERLHFLLGNMARTT
jgi:hypothetical protein